MVSPLADVICAYLPLNGGMRYSLFEPKKKTSICLLEY